MSAFLSAIRFSLLDMHGAARRLWLIIVCLTLGTMLIAGVNGVSTSLEAALARNAAILMGGDIEASRTDRPANGRELALLGDLGLVASVVDTNVRGKANGRDAFLDLVAISEGYPMLGSLGSPELPQGLPAAELLAERDGAHGVLVDPLVLQELDLAVGETMEIGGTLFDVRGTIARLPDATVRGFRLGLPVVVTLEGLRQVSDPTSPLPGLGTTYRYKVLLASGDAETGAEILRADLDDAGWTVRTARDGLGPMVRYYDMFMRFLLIVGLASLLIGGVSVWNGISAYVGQRSMAIAILRSLGARRSRVLLHFLVQISMLALIGVGSGLLGGLAITLVALPVVGDVLGLDLAPSLQPGAMLAAPLIGLVTAFTFALLPLLQAQNVQPSLLFRAHGLGVPPDWRMLLAPTQGLPLVAGVAAFIWLAVLLTNDFVLVLAVAAGSVVSVVAFRLALLVARAVLRRAPEPPNPIWRHALRSIAAVGSNAAALVVSIGVVVTVLAVVIVLQFNLRNEFLGASVFDAPTFVASDLFEDEVAILEVMEAEGDIVRLDAIPILRGAVVALGDKPASALQPSGAEASFLMSGDVPMSFADDMPEDSQLVAGPWWGADYDGAPLVSLHESLRQGLDVALGDTLTFEIFGERITAEVANFRSYAWQGGIDVLATFSPGVINAFPTTLFVAVTAPPGTETMLERRLAEALPGIGFIAIGETLTKITTALGQLSLAAFLVGGLAVANGLLVLAGSLAMGMDQRQADALITRVLGARRGAILGTAFLYHGLLAALSVLVAVAVGIGFAALLTGLLLGVQFALEATTLFGAGLATVAIVGVLGSLSLRRAVVPRPALYLRELGAE